MKKTSKLRKRKKRRKRAMNKQPDNKKFFNPLYAVHAPVSAKYTETIYGVIHNLAYKEIIKAGGYITLDEVLEIARPKIFNFSYPFYDDEEKRKALETGILQHFLFDEIGQETYAYWHYELQHWMTINMERYYELFKTLPFQDQEDPTANTDYTETYTRETTGKSATGGKDKSTNLSSTTPQGRIDLESTNYVDAITQSISEPGSTSDSEGLEKYSFHRHGNIGVQTMAEVLSGSRDAIITLENQLYEELEDYGLFYLLY